MKISEFITLLQEQQAQHGDLEIMAYEFEMSEYYPVEGAEIVNLIELKSPAVRERGYTEREDGNIKAFGIY